MLLLLLLLLLLRLWQRHCRGGHSRSERGAQRDTVDTHTARQRTLPRRLCGARARPPLGQRVLRRQADTELTIRRQSRTKYAQIHSFLFLTFYHQTSKIKLQLNEKLMTCSYIFYKILISKYFDRI